MRSLKVNAFAWLAGLAAVSPVWAADPITDAAVVYSHQALDGHSYFAVSLKGPSKPAVAVPHDHVILVDTSASQVGEHRTMAIEVLRGLLSALPATDRVQVSAIDMQSTSLTKGFVSPELASTQSMDTLQNRLPAGATDLMSALNAATAQIQTGRASSIVYIGDGMSSAHLIQASEMQALVTKLRERQIPIHGFAVGANKDLRLVGNLAQMTGGMALIDHESLDAVAVGQQLATAIDLPVIYPTSLAVHWKDAEVVPQQPLPLRSDRETFYLARGQWAVGASLSVQTPEGELSWNVPEAKFRQGNQYLAGFWDEAANGQQVPFAGVQFLQAARQSFADRVEQLEIAADNSLFKGDIAQADAVTDELRQLDPGNVHATGIKNRVGKLKVQTVALQEEAAEKAPATDATAPVVEAPAAEATVPEPPAAEAELPLETRVNPIDLSPIALEEARRKARTQKLQQQLEIDIKQAKQALSVSPEAAVTLLESSRGAIKSSMDIDADEKARLLKQADAALTDLRNQQEVLQIRIQAGEQRRAEQEAQERVMDFAAEQDEKLKQLVDRIRALMDDGYHGDENAFEEAEAVARIIESIAPNSATGTATVFVAEAAGQLSKSEHLQSLRYDRFLETLYQVELSHVPFPDEPPVRYPPAAVWQQLTLKRAKWKSVDLHKDSQNEQKISRALDQQTSLEFPDNTLKEVVQFIEQQHNIPIRLDEQALTDAGLDAETRINLVISGITLRSALKLMLENVNGTPLTFVIEDEVMKITTEEKALEKYQTRVYPVGDLVIPIRPLQGGGGVGGGQQQGQQGGQQQGGQQQGGGGGGQGFFSVPHAARAPLADAGKKNRLN